MTKKRKISKKKKLEKRLEVMTLEAMIFEINVRKKVMAEWIEARIIN